jgi:hypothetical protein
MTLLPGKVEVIAVYDRDPAASRFAKLRRLRLPVTSG